MEEISKKQIISSLYTIRAGLSQVAQKKEKVDGLLPVIEQNRKEHQRDRQRLISLKQKYQSNLDKIPQISFRERELKKEIPVLQEELNEERAKENALSSKIKQYKASKYDKVNNGYLVFSLIFLALIAINILVLVLIFKKDWSGWAILVSLFCSFVLFVVAAVVINPKEKIKKQEEQMQLEAKKLHDEIISKESQLSKLKDELRDINKPKYEVAETEALRQKLASPAEYLALENNVKTTTEEGLVIYSALETTYSSLLDTRDWGNVDLLIYYLETNRADTVKEALHCLDEQLRHTELMTLLAMATKEVCSRIESWGSRISMQLDNVAANQQNILFELQTNQQNITSSMQNISVNLGQLLSETNMQNALIQKQNVSSQKLMEEVSALRSHSDSLRYKNARF